jgi:hypothetical protein
MSPRTIALSLLAVAACGTDTPDPAPTYSELYTKYFAIGTPGHCATSGCHAGPDFNIWLCGPDKNTCYNGMTGPDAGLVNKVNPSSSVIINPANSPLSWFNPNGPMPQDMPGPFPEGRDAILKWVMAGALND